MMADVRLFLRPWFFLLLLWVDAARSVERSELFPFEESDPQLATVDNASAAVQLSIPVALYGQFYDTVHINNDGILTFLSPAAAFSSLPLPLNVPAIAPLYADVDLSVGGHVYYRETNESGLLDRVDKEIRLNFPAFSSYASQSLLIVTFADVAGFKAPETSGLVNGTANATNTMQVVVSTSGQHSFALLLFPAGGIQWLRGDGKVKMLPDAKAQSGFMSEDGRFLSLPFSGSDRVFNYDKMSNLIVPKHGVWLFCLGNTGSGKVEEPVSTTPERESCSQTRTPCVPSAKCLDRERGFCCACQEGLIGNGIVCVPGTEAQRINGKVTGNINGIPLTRLADDGSEVSVELHSYVVSDEGRCYTALSRVPSDLIARLQTLVTVGDVVGWMFAKSSPALPNGFTLTGGTFNRTAEIEFPDSDQRIFISESFVGHDVFGNLQAHVDISGSLPDIPTGSKIVFDDSAEDYTASVIRDRVTVQSRAAKKYRQEDGIEVPFTVDQQIYYSQCPFKSYNEFPHPVRLESSKMFVMLDESDAVVRFSAIYKTSEFVSQEICLASRTVCGDHSSCVVDDASPRCICDRGFQTAPRSGNCLDVNECALDRHRCHKNADCLNTLGSYVCRCRHGSVGDGFHCEQSLSCDSIRCDPNAECTIRDDQKPECKCRPGWSGNGFLCIHLDNSTQADCKSQTPSPCDPNAECLPDTRSAHMQQDETRDGVSSMDTVMHRCVCKAGFFGDGLICSQNVVLQCERPCGPHAICMLNQTVSQYQCMCLPGSVGDGYTCVTTPHSCDQDADCDARAKCLPTPAPGDPAQSTCQCLEGFVGDGKSCYKAELDPSELDCKVNKVCSPDADCLFSESEQRFACRCNDGFAGNGLSCAPRRPCLADNDCPLNSVCRITAISQQGFCLCNPGYNKTAESSFDCAPLPNAPCNLVPNCADNAICALNLKLRKHECLCKRGYKGNGTVCEKSVIPCNILNNCDVRAKCEYNMDDRGFRCKCGEGYVGDGLSCQPSRPCNEDPQQCDSNADCVLHAHLQSYSCQCRHSFVGDGLQCTPTPSYDGDYLIFSQGMSLLRLPINPSEGNPGQLLLTKSPQTPISLDVDCFEGFIYWSDVTMRTIRRTPYNGTFSEILLTSTGSPEGLAIDWVSRNIFWVDTKADVIRVARLDAMSRSKTVIADGLHDPRDVVVHPGLGKIYWTDWYRPSPSIQFSNTDGSERSVLVGSDLSLPNMLTIDFHTNDLCWSDAGLQRIECADLRGGNRRVVFTPADYPFGVTTQADLIFWTDWKRNTVQRVSRRGGQAESLSLPAGGNGKVYDIVTVPKQCPQMSNACAVANGGCQAPADICLPNERGRTCACPDASNSTDPDSCSPLT